MKKNYEESDVSDHLALDPFILPQMPLWHQNEIMRRKNVMASGGYYVATHILTVWKRLADLAPDQPQGWSFPDAEALWIKWSIWSSLGQIEGIPEPNGWHILISWNLSVRKRRISSSGRKSLLSSRRESMVCSEARTMANLRWASGLVFESPVRSGFLTP